MSKAPAIRGQYNKVIGYEVPFKLEGCKTHKAKKIDHASLVCRL